MHLIGNEVNVTHGGLKYIDFMRFIDIDSCDPIFLIKLMQIVNAVKALVQYSKKLHENSF